MTDLAVPFETILRCYFLTNIRLDPEELPEPWDVSLFTQMAAPVVIITSVVKDSCLAKVHLGPLAEASQRCPHPPVPS